MEIKSNQEPDTLVELGLCDDCLPTFSPLLQQGVMVPLDAETIISPFLYQNLGLSPDFVEQFLATVFLNGKPVDDLDQAILRSGDTLALSAAMPGLVGAAMRRKGLLASFRSSISHRPEEYRGPGTRIGPLIAETFQSNDRNSRPDTFGKWDTPHKKGLGRVSAKLRSQFMGPLPDGKSRWEGS